MPTIRSHFSFQQFEEALQKLAHGMAIEAVMNLNKGLHWQIRKHEKNLCLVCLREMMVTKTKP